jgi:F0F1-type ATP synthase delta subunit
MVIFFLPKWAKFNELTRHSKLYREFPAMTQLLTHYSLDKPTKEEVVAPTP